MGIGYDYSKFDWTKPITRDHIDMKIYNRKFELANSLIMNPNPKTKAHPTVIASLLRDKTIRIYCKFRIDNKPIKLYPYQDFIINDPHLRKYFRAANQIGKSEYIDCDASDNLTTDHGFGFNCAICSISLKQATFQMLRIKDRLYSSRIFDWKEEKGETDNLSMLSYDVPDTTKEVDRYGKYPKKYTNRLIIVPTGEGILGFDLHWIYPDEFEFWKDVNLRYFVNQLAEPRTYATNGGITFTTNPNGTESYGAELESITVPNGKLKYHTYIFNFLDRPGNTLEKLDIAKAGKSRAEIESTLLAIRTTSDRNYFSSIEVENSEWSEINPVLKMVGEHPFAFLDVGSKIDQSCFGMGFIKILEGFDEMKHVSDKSNWAYVELYIPIIHLYPVGYPISRVVGATSMTQDSDGWHYEKSVKEYLNEWTCNGITPTFGCDITGNSGISPLFQSLGIDVVDVLFSGPNKSGYYQRFKYMMEMGLLKRINHKEWENQAKQVIVTKSARGYLLINSAGVNTGGQKESSRLQRIPDDCLDMTAGLIALSDPINNTPVSMRRI